VELKRRFGVRVPRTLYYPSTKVHRMITMHVRRRRTDERTSWQSATIRSNERIVRYKNY